MFSFSWQGSEVDRFECLTDLKHIQKFDEFDDTNIMELREAAREILSILKG